MTKVFVIVLNWNQPEVTIECLESIEKITPSGYELTTVIVDNGSTDDSLKKLSKFNRPGFVIIPNKKNLGFTGGNNVGIKYALTEGADYIIILNNDTLVHKNLITNLLDVARDPQVGAVSPLIYFAKGFEFHKDRYKKNDLGKVIWYAGGKIDWNNVYGSTRAVDEVDKGQFKKVEETDFATGTCMLLSSAALRKIGGFDDKYFMYYDDTDLSMRLKKANYKILFDPNSIVWHKVSTSSGIGSKLHDYYTTRNRMIFGMKYASLRTKVALLRESINLLLNGREWQKIGIADFYFGNFGKGSWK